MLQRGPARIFAVTREAGGVLKTHQPHVVTDVISRLLYVVILLLTLIPASAQNGASVDKSPSFKVVGFYSLSADKAAYSRFIQSEIDSYDPANFSEETKEKLRRLGRDPQPYTDEDRREEEEELRSYMDDAAAFEVMVTKPDASFDIGKFVQPEPSLSEGFWQVASNERFLTPDGETLINLDRAQKLPDAPQYRIVFVIHFWKAGLPLRYSDEELVLPTQQPLPDRLWRLAPYRIPGR
jgi:hypothetical protein